MLYSLIFNMFVWFEDLSPKYNTAHPWRNGYSTSTNACGVWKLRIEVQVSKREFYTHIHLRFNNINNIGRPVKH